MVEFQRGKVLRVGQDAPDNRSTGADVHLDTADKREDVTDQCDRWLAVTVLFCD
jgi:hypothetical protein